MTDNCEGRRMINNFVERGQQFSLEKKVIGYYVAYLLRNEVPPRGVAIDGGSSNYYVVEGICKDAREGRKTVPHVLTNNLEALSLAKDIPEDVGPIWFCTGGMLRKSRRTFIDDADKPIMPIKCWTAVVGANGFEPLSLETTTRTEHHMKHAMIGVARYVIFPVDPSKWGCPAGKEFANLGGVVENDKRVSLVTCFPIQDDHVPSRKFNERVENLLKVMKSVQDLWGIGSGKHKIEVYASAVDERLDFADDDFTEVQFTLGASTILELERFYRQAYTKGHYTVVRFDLWEEKFPGLM